MAHYAQLDENNQVINVVVVDNINCLDANGNESEQIGCDYLNGILPGRWIQTSYNGRIRKNYAGIGYTYDSSADAFIAPQPFPSWRLDTDTYQWSAPEAYPSDGHYIWNEASISWQQII